VVNAMNFFKTIACLATMSVFSALSAAPVIFQSSENRVTLLEVFTSEGCSSCPPAEKWLTSLKTSPGLWKDFVPVAFHVDYWDYLGWRDPWSAKVFTDRQHAYARAWQAESVYTPGFVLDGKEWRAWSLSKSVPHSAAKAGVLTATSTDLKEWLVTFAPTASLGQSYEAHAALLASGLSSEVKAGENKGRRLEHDFVALNLVSTPLKFNSGTFTGRVSLDPKSQAGLSLAVWVTKSGQPEPLQAVGGRLAQTP
jgi:hypothetical protein